MANDVMFSVYKKYYKMKLDIDLFTLDSYNEIIYYR